MRRRPHLFGLWESGRGDRRPDGANLPFSVGAPAILDLRGKLPVHATKRYGTRDLSAVEWLVIHHSGVDVDSTAAEIARYHVEVMGWPGIGYWGIAHQDGRAEITQDLSVMSYHVAGRNRECAGICLVGDYTHKQPPSAQLEAARLLIARARRELGRKVPIERHGILALPGYATNCPGATWPQWKGALQ